jgi:hypothetical protein
MRGAPDLAAEDIGNVQKFNEFLKQHAQYAANARDQNATWSTVAGLLSRYAEDLAIAFTACASKRGEHTSYTTEQVLNLSDDAFEKLYVESCFPSVEYPSEVLEVLQNISFRRQHSKEASPLHAVMRAAEAFRVQLRLLPSHAVHQCTEDGILIAFFRLLFGDDAKRRRMDFQHCTTWAEARTALIQRATSQPSWFGDSLKETSMESDLGTTKKSVSTSVQSAASSQSSQDTTKPAAYYERRASQLIKEGALEGIDTSGLSAKQVVKLATKLRFAAKSTTLSQVLLQHQIPIGPYLTPSQSNRTTSQPHSRRNKWKLPKPCKLSNSHWLAYSNPLVTPAGSVIVGIAIFEKPAVSVSEV